MELGLSPTRDMQQLVNFDRPSSPDYPLTGTPSFQASANQLILRIFLGVEINFLQKEK